jgi:hypothetical protein
MSDYTPDKWLMVKLTNKDNESHYRIFACWYGGYLGSDSWKLNSGVTKITEDERSYYFEGSSGSVYECNKSWYGISGYGAGVLANLMEKSKDTVSIEILSEETSYMELQYERTD